MKLTIGKGPVVRPLKPLHRLDLVREVVERLREQIIGRVFGPTGAIPPEGELGQALGVSRTVIREAMRSLAAQGLVEVSQGRRPRVKPADPQTVVDTFSTYLQREDHCLLDLVEVRQPLETAIAALAADRATEADLESLEQSILEQAAARTRNQRIEEDIHFHALLARATGNPVFTLLLKAVVGLLRRSLQETLARSGIERSLEGHRTILAAIRRHDADAARQAMFDHLTHAEQDLREKVR
jgi:GntR family transcriptional regulator, transcriptional repressor for pyruvate dehydrogenase complex